MRKGAALEGFRETPDSTPVAVPARRRWRLPARMIGVCCWLYLGTVLGLWGLLAAADLWWPATFFLFSPRWAVGLPLLLLLPAAALVRRRSVLPLLIALVLVVGPVMGFCVPWQRLLASPPEGKQFRILSCNMHYYSQSSVPLERLVAAARPDIVVLQEWSGSQESPAFAGGGWYTHDVRGLYLASIHPLRRTTQFGDDSTRDNASIMRYELDTAVGTVNVFSLHLASPRDGLSNVVHRRGTAADDLQAGSELRWRQSEYLARAAAADVTGPLLLAGDFNTPPESAIFRTLWGGYTDSFSVAGWGWGYTFKGGRTMVRIDHILAGPGWHCDRCWVGPNIGSPHRPVVAELTWPAAAP